METGTSDNYSNSFRGSKAPMPPSSSICSIPKVPERLRHINQSIYTPKAVSIGPYHHGRKELQAMEEYKKRCLHDFIDMTKRTKGQYIDVVQQKEGDLRAYYAEDIEFESSKFVDIILVDAAFIILFLLRLNYRELVVEGDRIFGRGLLSQDICFDMLLLENQLPFFILVDLFNAGIEMRSDSADMIDIFDLSCNLFKVLMDLKVSKSTLEVIRSTNIQHFVDFLRGLSSPVIGQGTWELQTKTLQSKDSNIDLSLLLKKNARKESRTVKIPSITMLHKAGVRFKVGGSTNLFDLRFRNGILEFPGLIIGEESMLSTLNMLAFEKCCLGSKYINDSIVLMDNLIKTQKDIDLLVNFGILENRLGCGGSLSLLIKELAGGTFLNWNGFWFASLCENLNTYCRSSSRRWKIRWYDWKENLIETYFKTPWSGISVIAAVVLLTLTVVQTVYAILSFHSSNSFGN